MAYGRSNKNFGPNVIYWFFEKCGSTRADEVYLGLPMRYTWIYFGVVWQDCKQTGSGTPRKESQVHLVGTGTVSNT